MPQSSQQIRRTAKRLFRWCLVNDQLDQRRARMVAQHVLGTRRRGHILLAHQFGRLLRLERARHLAKVESAFTLPLSFRARVHTSLNALYGPNITTSFVPNHRLIGGMRIQIGSDVYDGSVRAKLDHMAQTCGLDATRTNARVA